MTFRQVTIVGLGLIGGSLGIALRRRRLARRVVGVARRPQTIRQAKARGAIDRGTTCLCEGTEGSDLVVLAVPPLSVVPVARELARWSDGEFLLTDVASTKARIVRELDRILPARISFVGCHPMAGSDRSGLQAADGGLFEGAICVVTPTARSRAAAVSRVRSLWRGVGSRVVLFSPERHDQMVAQVSHLPHLTAAALVSVPQRAALRLAAGGFSDTTRVAQGDPELWAEICQTNARAIGAALAQFQRELVRARSFIARRDFRGLRRWLAAAQVQRREV